MGFAEVIRGVNIPLLKPRAKPTEIPAVAQVEAKPATIGLNEKLNTVFFELFKKDNLDLYLIKDSRKISSQAKAFTTGLFETFTDKTNANAYSYEEVIFVCQTKRQIIKDAVSKTTLKALRQTSAYQKIVLQRGILNSLEQKAKYQLRISKENELVATHTNAQDILDFTQGLREQGKTIPKRKGFLLQAFHRYAVSQEAKQLVKMQALGIKPEKVSRLLEQTNSKTLDPVLSIFKARQTLIEQAEEKARVRARVKAIVEPIYKKARIATAALVLQGALIGGNVINKPTTKLESSSHQITSPFTPEINPLMEVSTNLQAELTTVLHPEPKLHFQDSNGKKIGEYHKILFEPQTEYPEDYLTTLNNLEGPIYQKSIDFFTKFTARNIMAIIDPSRPFSGGSDQPMQLLELLGGNYDYSLLNPNQTRAYHHPEAYGLEYLTHLVKAAFSDQKEIPIEIQQKLKFINASVPTPNQLTGNFSEDTIKRICAKLETLIEGRELVETHGQEEILTLYANFVPLAATKDGLPIYGLPAASQYLFGKPITKLNKAEQLITIGLIQAPAEYLSDYQFAIDRARTLLKILKNKGNISQLEFDEISSQLSNITFTDPEISTNNWITRLPYVYSKQIYEAIDSVNHGQIPSNSEQTENTIFITLEALSSPEAKPPQKISTSVNLEPREIVSIPFNEELKNFIDKKLTKNPDGTYTFELTQSQKVIIPEFEGKPGIAVEMIDVTDPDKPFTLANYDQSRILLETPFSPGSTFKAYVTTFLIDIVGIDPYTQKIPNSPGKFTLVSTDLVVRNANARLNEVRKDNELTLAQALASSSNVPFQKLMKEYLDSKPNGWQIFTDYLDQNFGLKLYDIYGNPLTETTLFAAIGSDNGVYLSDLARAFGVVTNPSENLSPRTRLALKQTLGILQDQELKKTPIQGTQVWSQQSLEYFKPTTVNGTVRFKTGTTSVYIGENAITSDLVTIGSITTKDGRKIAIATRIRGQINGKTTNLEKYNLAGSNAPLPISRQLLEFASETPNYPNPYNLTSPQKAIDLLQKALENPREIGDKYQVAQISAKTSLLDPFRNPIRYLEEGQSIDIVGNPKNGLVPVSFKIGENQLTTGFVRSEDISSKSLSEFGNTKKLEALHALETLVSKDSGLKYVLVNPVSSSPLLSQIAKDLTQRNQLISGPEDYQSLIQNIAGFDPTRTVFINEPLLNTYLGKSFDPNNLTIPQTTLKQVIGHSQELFKFSIIAAESRTGVTLQDLYWNNREATPSSKLIDFLINKRLASSPDMQLSEKQLSQLEASPKTNQSEGTMQKIDQSLQLGRSERIERIINLFNEMMNKIENGQRIISSKAKSLTGELQSLNSNPTKVELEDLGIQFPESTNLLVRR